MAVASCVHTFGDLGRHETTAVVAWFEALVGLGTSETTAVVNFVDNDDNDSLEIETEWEIFTDSETLQLPTIPDCTEYGNELEGPLSVDPQTLEEALGIPDTTAVASCDEDFGGFGTPDTTAVVLCTDVPGSFGTTETELLFPTELVLYREVSTITSGCDVILSVQTLVKVQSVGESTISITSLFFA